MTDVRGGPGPEWVLNWFRIEEIQNLRLEFHIFDVNPQPQGSLDRYQRMKRIADKMRMEHRKDDLGWIDASLQGRQVLLVPSTCSVKDHYECESGEKTAVIHQLVRRPDLLTLPALSPSTRAFVAGVLRSCLRLSLMKQYSKLWRDGDRFYIMASRERKQRYFLYRGFSSRIEAGDDGALYLVLDSVARFLDIKTLEEHYGPARAFDELREYCATPAAHQRRSWFAIRKGSWFSNGILAEVVPTPCSDFRIKKDGQTKSLYEEYSRLGARATDFVVGLKYYSEGETHYFPASLVSRILWTDDIGEEENPSVLSPEDRMAMIRTALKCFDSLTIGGKALKLSPEPLVSCGCLQLSPPVLEFKDGKKVSVRSDDPSVKFVKIDSLKRIGPSQPSSLRQPYLLIPETVPTDQQRTLKVHLETVARVYGENLDFAVFPYKDPREAAQRVSSDKSSNRGCVIVLRQLYSPDYGVFKSGITNTVTQCAGARTVINARPPETAQVALAAEGRGVPPFVRHYVNRLSQVVLGLVAKAGGKPWILGEPLSYYPAVGVDIGGADSRFASYAAFLDPFGKVLKATESVPQRDEELTVNDLASALLGLLTGYREVDGAFVAPSLVLYRDGEIKGAEAEAVKSAAKEAKARGLLREGASVGIVEVRKSNPYRIFLRNQGKLFNPRPGCWLRLSETDALLAATGEPWITDASAQPLFLRLETIEGAFDLEKIVRDTFLMSELNISAPTLPYKSPLIIALADRRSSEMSDGITSAGPSF